MVRTDSTSGVPAQPPHQPGASRLADCGDVLERLVIGLHRSRDDAAQIHVALQAVRTLLGADVVFWYPHDEQAAIDSVGDWQISPSWRRDFVKEQLATAPLHASQLCRSYSIEECERTPFRSRSVVMVRFSKVKQVWMVAVSFSHSRKYGEEDVKLMSLVRRLLLQERQRARALDNVHSTLLGVVRCLTEAINANNPYTRDHSERVARIAVRLGQEMGLPANIRSALYLGGLLHDIGKVGIDTGVLQQTAPLTHEQRLHIQEHPVIGDRILGNVPTLSHLRPAVRNHHERMDGAGYPDGLQGEQIPLIARIMAVADACDAMFSPRPYRTAMSADTVDGIMAAGAGQQWDPDIIRHFFSCRTELYAIYKRGLGDSVEKALIDVVHNHIKSQ